METGKGERTGSDLKYQSRLIGTEEWLDPEFHDWSNFLRLDFFDHEKIILALEKNPGKMKTSKIRQYRVMK